jgi:hypothetical protein
MTITNRKPWGSLSDGSSSCYLLTEDVIEGVSVEDPCDLLLFKVSLQYFIFV